MRVQINGAPTAAPDTLTVNDLLALQGVDAVQVVVEVNGSIVRREDFGAVLLAPGDAVEILRFVGGG